MARVEDGDRAATLAADRLDHVGALGGWIETHHPAGPAQTGRHHGRDGFEAAGAGKDEAMGGPGWKGCKVVGDEPSPPAPAPGEGVLRVEIDTGYVIAIDAIALPDHDAAGFREEARHLLHRHPARVAMQGRV